MIFGKKGDEVRHRDFPPTPLEDVTLDVIIEKCEKRGMAWKDIQTFVGYLARRVRDLEK